MVHAYRSIKWIGLLAIAGLVIALLNPFYAQASSQTLTFTPSADAYVNQTFPTSNYGSNISIRVDNSPARRSYVRFNVTGLNSNPVSKAILKIYAKSSLSEGFTVNQLSNNNWTESTINYNNAPAAGAKIAGSGAVTSGQWVSIDISSYISGEGTYNLVLTSSSSTQLNLASRETGSTAPQLVVSYTTSDAIPTPIKDLSPTARITLVPTTISSLTPIAAATSPSVSPTSTPTNTVGSGQVPTFSHVIIMIFENKDYTSIIGNTTLPNFNSLANKYTLLTNSYAVGHPSLPNYIAFTSGSTQGITSDCTDCFLNVTNIADSIEASGRTWKGYMESMPSPCFVGSSGLYVQKHDPFVYYNDIRNNSTRCMQDVVPITQLDTDLQTNNLPNFAWITPNQCNNAHDCSSATADKFVGAEVNKIITSPAFDQNSLLIVTFDEGSTSASCCGLPSGAGGHIATILISSLVKSGLKDATSYSHYSVLKTIEKSWGMPYLVHTGDTATSLITAPWK